MHLDDFCQWLNEDVGGEGLLPDIKHGDYGLAMKDSLHRHYAQDRQKGGVRMSNLGKPAVLLALAKLGYSEPEPKGKSRLIFHMGDMFENWLEVMLQVYGIEILDSQPTVTWNGVVGHADYVIKSPATGQNIVVEAKTMSENYFRMFSREQNDDRGYLTQLALYMQGLGMDGTWLCLNKGNATVHELYPDNGLLAASIRRVKKVLERIDRINTLDDVFLNFRPPPPHVEMFQKQPTGKYILPTSMSFSPFKSALYKITDGLNGYNKPTKYVDGVADTEHMKKELAFLLENGVIGRDV